MSSSAQAGVRMHAPSSDLVAGARFVLWVLADEADERWSCDVSVEAIVAVTGLHDVTVRRYLKQLEEGGWIARERRRNSDGSWGSYRTWLRLEKLGLDLVHRALRSVAGEGGEAVDNINHRAVGPTVTALQPPSAALQPPSAALGPKEGFLPSLLPFPVREAHFDLIGRVLAICGPGLADWKTHRRVLVSLAHRLDEERPDSWLPRFDLEADILPVVTRQTAKARPKPVLDFALFDEDLAAHRLERIRASAPGAEEAAAIARQAAIDASARADREHRLKTQRDIIAQIDGGEIDAPADELVGMRARAEARIRELEGV